MPAQTKKSRTSSKTAAARKKSNGSAAKKKSATGRSARSAAASTTARKARKKPSRVLIVCAIVVFWALSLITLLHLGIAGHLLYGLLSFFIGSFTYLLLIGGMITSFLYIWNGGQRVLDARTLWGLAILGLAWCTGCALFQLPADQPYALWQDLLHNWQQVLSGAKTTWSGLLGAGLAGVLTPLFAKAGAWIMTAAFGLVGLALVGWNHIRQWWLDYQSCAPSPDADSARPGVWARLRSAFSMEDEDEQDPREQTPVPGYFSQSIQQTGPDPLQELNLGIEAEGPIKESTSSARRRAKQKKNANSSADGLQILDQKMKAGSAVQTAPFSFEKAAQLLDAQPQLLEEETLTIDGAGSAAGRTEDVVLMDFSDTAASSPASSKPSRGSRWLDSLTHLTGKQGTRSKGQDSGSSNGRFLKKGAVQTGLGITADDPQAGAEPSLAVSVPDFGASNPSAAPEKEVVQGFGITADGPAHPVSGHGAQTSRSSAPAPKSSHTSGTPEEASSMRPSARARQQAAARQPDARPEAEVQEAWSDLAALPGKNEDGVSRSRPRPEEPVDKVPASKGLPAASSTDLSRYRLPKIQLLNDPGRLAPNNANAVQARKDGAKLISILNEFGVKADLNDIHIGPSVTKFEITPGQGVRVNSITNLQNDIKMALAATDIRIEAPIPGKSAVGIEVPNVEKTEVSMRDLLRTLPKKYANLPLVFALGKDLLGDNVYGRLDTMPHLLIAGATGSGKSVCVNAIISSILMRTRPDEVKLILVDPKKVEFTPYNGVPHLLAPVITDGDLANKALQVVVAMMDRRYDLFEETMVRNITAYNAYVDQNPDSHYKKLPRIVVIIDELADLMLAAAKEVEQSIQRITQLARAAGIHLIVATQRPSVNVITGVIKANIPSRIAFAVSSTVDSRTILDQAGAERLLGYGDMLFLDNGDSAPRRIQGVYIKDEEVMRIAEYVKSQAAPMYDDAFITLKDLQSQGGQVAPQDVDPLYEEVKHFVITSRKASTSLIQRRFSIGYARAARLVDALECSGVVGPANGSKPREILAAPNYDPDDLDL